MEGLQDSFHPPNMYLLELNRFVSPQIPFMGTKHSLGPPHVFAKMPFMYLSSETEHKSLIVADIVHLCKKMVNFI